MSPAGPTEHPEFPRLQIEGLAVAYAERSVLSDVSLSVNTGELLVLLGPNGSGKSTLVKAISAQLSPTRGRVLIDGQPLCGDSSSHRSVGVVPQSIALFLRLSVWENLRAFGALMGVDEPHIDERAEAVLTTIGLPDRRDDPVGALSGGMQRRVNIGVALICEPRLLLLDEPSVGVDRQGRARLADILGELRSSGLGMVLVTHDLEEAELLADRVAVLVDGSVRAYGTIPDLIDQAFGERRLVRVELDAHGKKIPEVLQRFERLADTVWESLMDLAPGDLDALFEQLRGAGLGLKEVRVIRPGLAELLGHLTESQGTNGAMGLTGQ